MEIKEQALQLYRLLCEAENKCNGRKCGDCEYGKHDANCHIEFTAEYLLLHGVRVIEEK